MNKVKMVVDKNNLTVKFECEGDVYKWLRKKKNDSHTAFEIYNYIKTEEVKSFFYETTFNKFLRRFRDEDVEVVAGSVIEGSERFQVYCEA